MERLKTISRSATADAEAYRPELAGDDEPRYLRRQKPVEIRRKKFSGRTWPFYRRVLFYGVIGIAGVSAAWTAGRFLLYGKQMLLVKPEQIEINGNHIVSRDAVLQQFVRDRGRSVLRIPLDARRSALEEISWIESAAVQRVLPNRIRIDLIERTPIAFLRNGTELALIDSHGVILDRPRGEDLQFPIITGLSESMPREERGKRMQTYQEFMTDVELVRSGSSDRVSEVDLANPKDLRAVMTGIASPNDPQALTIHFGAGDFTGKYRMVVENFAQWQASNGRVHSIDLQYAKQVVLNPESNSTSAAKTR
ncbi:MAG TPA: FtsQ-type POTRA domain-containing protein [Candidatus Acidoferrum sp.]|nr:FtsQ-type POTRA domain-containing protein [Candidatus Acidoferrum sp.]